jgi:hypothetical protein
MECLEWFGEVVRNDEISEINVQLLVVLTVKTDSSRGPK